MTSTGILSIEPRFDTDVRESNASVILNPPEAGEESFLAAAQALTTREIVRRASE